MLKRKILNILLKWKEDRKSQNLKECLTILGARQVGKTYLIEKQLKKEYKTFLKINFAETPDAKEIFAGSKTKDDIFKKLTAYFSNEQMHYGDTLLFLDEIQKCGDARTAIKFMAEDFRYDVITSGSLLGLAYGDDDDDEITEPDSIPVGYERKIHMYSLDFEEFLWAMGVNDDAIGILKDYFNQLEKIPNVINEKYEQLFREFMVLGGMPEVVDNFAQYHDFARAFDIQNKILSNYEDDIAKHAKGAEKIKVKGCYDSIKRQLAKEFKKFQYSNVEKKQTAKKYGGSVKWLIDSNIVNPCYNVFEPFIPLAGNEKENEFKLYMHDTGLLCSMYGNETKKLLLSGELKGNVKGGIYENVIAESLVKKGYKLHYYHPNDNRELEFIIEKDGEVVPIEVKSTNSTTISLNDFISEFNPSIAYKIIEGNIGKINAKVTLPHYMVMFL